MRRSIGARALSWTTLASLTILLAGTHRPVLGQDEATEAEPAVEKPAEPAVEKPAEPTVEKTAEPAVEKTEAFRGRLPNYYRFVVDEKQREAIYKIQEEYAAKIDALKAQLAALTKERDAKVAAVLTPEQLKEVEQRAAEAKAKREAKKAGTKKSAPAAPATQ